MVIAKTRIKTHENYASIIPVIIPDLDEVRKFAAKLHAEGKPWKGEAFGWQAEYNPERPGLKTLREGSPLKNRDGTFLSETL